MLPVAARDGRNADVISAAALADAAAVTQAKCKQRHCGLTQRPQAHVEALQSDHRSEERCHLGLIVVKRSFGASIVALQRPASQLAGLQR